jgi:predicted nucleotide-binding protein
MNTHRQKNVLMSRVFVASSLEGLNVAYAVQQNLEHDAEVTAWSQGAFEPSSYLLNDLENAADNSDFAIFVFSPDDVTKLRGRKFATVRDNVILELGLFIGKISRDRTFVLQPRPVENLHLPTDLLGMKCGAYNAARADENWRAALGPACNEIRQRIKKMGRRS